MSTPAKSMMREIRFKLTDAELALRAKDAAKIRSEMNEIEDEIKDFNKQKKQELSDKKLAMAKLMSIFETGQEPRDVECTIIRDFDKGVVQFMNSGVIVEERAMTIAERQATIDDMNAGGEMGESPQGEEPAKAEAGPETEIADA